MNRKTVIAGICAALLAAPIAPLHADMDDFKDRIEEAESDKTETGDKKEHAGGSSDNAFFRALFDLTCKLWFLHNTTTTYNSWPYATDGYIKLAGIDAAGEAVEPVMTGRRNSWYTAETQAFWLQGAGGGPWFTLRGNAWRFFGPYIETCILTDGDRILSGARLGAQFSVIQTDPFSLSFYGQWQTWSGLLDRSGGTFGIEMRSDPAKPLTLQLRAGFQTFERFSIAEAELRTGWMLDRWELFGGWRWWNLSDSGGNHVETWPGPFAGAALWF